MAIVLLRALQPPIAYLITEDFAIDMRKVSYRGSYGERCGE